MPNAILKKARNEKNDEFYTQLSDIENELKHYKNHFKGKTVLCNCDDPRISNFFHYFSYKFHQENGIPNYPKNIKYADMTGIDNLEEKERLLDKWKY